MKKLTRPILFLLIGALPFNFMACDSEDDAPLKEGENSKTYTLNSVSDPGINGTVEFQQMENNSTTVTILLTGTPDGGEHPAHIHMGSVSEAPGDIAVTLNSVDGDSGGSITLVTEDNNGNLLSYDDLVAYDGYINVHMSESNLETLVAQGDIGGNELIGSPTTYALNEVADSNVEGTVSFQERVNGNALGIISLQGTTSGNSHPAHIHMNSAVETGPIVYTFNPVDGATGMSMSNIEMLEDGSAFGYDDILTYDGYVNVHLSATQLTTVVSQGNIGANSDIGSTTGRSTTYALSSTVNDAIDGTATFEELTDGSTAITLDINGTVEGDKHPAHIHMGTAAEGPGEIAITLDTINGGSGMSLTIVKATNAGATLNYDDLIDYDGYINVHLSKDDLTVVAQGDIGQNVLTGNMMTYDLAAKNSSGVEGTIMFEERMNGEVLATINVSGDIDPDTSYPAHIHEGTTLDNGAIAVGLSEVDGSTGMSMTNISTLTYAQIIDYDGYVNIHMPDLSVISQGDIGQNDLTTNTISYDLNEVDGSGISGSIMFTERVNGTALATFTLMGTSNGFNHAAHIHMGSIAEAPGDIALTFTSDMLIDGETGISSYNVTELDNGTAFGYDDILTYDGYINVHNPTDPTIVDAQGDIGSNAGN